MVSKNSDVLGRITQFSLPISRYVLFLLNRRLPKIATISKIKKPTFLAIQRQWRPSFWTLERSSGPSCSEIKSGKTRVPAHFIGCFLSSETHSGANPGTYSFILHRLECRLVYTLLYHYVVSARTVGGAQYYDQTRHSPSVSRRICAK